MSRQARHSYEFGPFRVDAVERRLLRDDQPVPLQPKEFDTLLALVSNSGHLLTKDELLKTVWPDSFVEENNLTQRISAVRKALGDNGEDHTYIETIPRVGYRFAPGVREILDEGEDVFVENRTKYRIVVKEEEGEEERETREAETRGRGDAETRRVRDLYLPASPRRRVAVSLLVVAALVGLAFVLLLLVSKAGKREPSLHLAGTGRFDEAVAEMKRSLKIDPLSLISNANLGWILYVARQYDEASEQLQKTLELDPNFARARVYLGRVYLQKGMYAEAIEELQKATTLLGRNNFVLAALGYAYAASGRKSEAQSVLDQLRVRSKREYVSAYDIARVYAGLGDSEAALEWLEKAYEDKAAQLIWLKVDPQLDSVHFDPRFTALLRRMNLAS